MFWILKKPAFCFSYGFLLTFTVLALSMVSAVVKVLEMMTTCVSAEPKKRCESLRSANVLFLTLIYCGKSMANLW